MSDNIKIAMSEVSQSASNIRSLNATLDEILNSITSQMNDLRSIWQSDGQESIVAHFKTFANRFTMESQTIEEYCKFLDLTVSTYETVESTIQGNSNNFE